MNLKYASGALTVTLLSGWTNTFHISEDCMILDAKHYHNVMILDHDNGCIVKRYRQSSELGAIIEVSLDAITSCCVVRGNDNLCHTKIIGTVKGKSITLLDGVPIKQGG